MSFQQGGEQIVPNLWLRWFGTSAPDFRSARTRTSRPPISETCATVVCLPSASLRHVQGDKDAGAGRDGQGRDRALRSEAEPAIGKVMLGQAGEAGPARRQDGGCTDGLRTARPVRPEHWRAPELFGQSEDKLRLLLGDVAVERAAGAPAARIAEIVHALSAPSR